jgi:hypothetical protein
MAAHRGHSGNSTSIAERGHLRGTRLTAIGHFEMPMHITFETAGPRDDAAGGSRSQFAKSRKRARDRLDSRTELRRETTAIRLLPFQVAATFAQ